MAIYGVTNLSKGGGRGALQQHGCLKWIAQFFEPALVVLPKFISTKCQQVDRQKSVIAVELFFQHLIAFFLAEIKRAVLNDVIQKRAENSGSASADFEDCVSACVFSPARIWYTNPKSEFFRHSKQALVSECGDGLG